MALTKEDILNAVADMSVMDVCELVKMMGDKFGVSAAAAVAVAAPSAAAAPAAEEKTDFNIVLESFGENKVGVIKVVREITGLGLKEAKDAVEGVPSTLKEGVAKAEAEGIVKKLVEAGAKASLK